MPRILVVNAGSSSLRLSVLGDGDEPLHETMIELPAGKLDPARVSSALAGTPLGTGVDGIVGVGHRVVHGGDRFSAPVLVDEAVEQELRALVDLAPLHQPRALAALDVVRSELPGVPHVACFDTAFHASLPLAARTYALPRDWREQWGLRRYGFHGLSHAWVARHAPRVLGWTGPPPRIVSCHLGAGASACAIAAGASQDTTMGFTPLEGLVMATRAGSVDPGLLMWLVDRRGIRAEELEDALEHRSGLAGLTGSGDMRKVLGAAAAGDADAVLALDVYVHRLRQAVAAMAAALGDLDVLVFTGGVGEHAAEVRAHTAAGLGFLGVRISPAANAVGPPEREITAPGAPVRTAVVRAREDLEIRAQVLSVLSPPRVVPASDT